MFFSLVIFLFYYIDNVRVKIKNKIKYEGKRSGNVKKMIIKIIIMVFWEESKVWNWWNLIVRGIRKGKVGIVFLLLGYGYWIYFFVFGIDFY